MGLLAQQGGDAAAALDLLSRAAARNAGIAELQDSLGSAYAAVGRFSEAIASHHRACALRPDFAEARFNLGNAYGALGRFDKAADCFRTVLTLRPDHADSYNNLGQTEAMRRQWPAAAEAFGRAVLLRPDFAAAHNNLGNVFKDMGDFSASVDCFRRALALREDFPEADYNLANALFELGRLDAAVALFRRVISRRPDLTDAYNNLGSALYLQGSSAGALSCFARALRLDPSFHETHANIGTLLRDDGQIETAITAYRQAIALKSDYDLAHSNLAVSLLAIGNYEEGPGRVRMAAQQWPPDAAPAFSDAPLARRRPHRKNHSAACRAGLGRHPAVRALRPDVWRHAGQGCCWRFIRPCCVCSPAWKGVAAVLATGDPLAPHDWHLPMMSAAHLLGTRLETIPAAIPYLHAEDAASAAWKVRLDAHDGRKVGLVWAGDPRPHDPRAPRHRSPPQPASRPDDAAAGDPRCFRLQPAKGGPRRAKA